MELNLSSVVELLGTPLNDEDLYAICEKLCQAILALGHNARGLDLVKERVFLTHTGCLRIEESGETYRQKITHENLLANHVYSIGTLLQYLAKVKAVNRQRDDTLDSLMTQMASPDPAVRPQLELVAQACQFVLQSYEVSADAILGSIYDDVKSHPDIHKCVKEVKKSALTRLMKPRSKSPYQLISINDAEGELRDGMLSVEDTDVEEEEEREEEGIEEGSQEVLDSETDLDVTLPEETTWDYDHMEVTAADDEGEEPKEEKGPVSTLSPGKEALLGDIGRQTTEDLEVEVLTASFEETLPLFEPAPSDSSDSPVHEFRSIPNNEPVKPLLTKLLSEEIIQSDSEEEKVESKPFKKPDKPRPKVRDLWKKAGLKARSSVSDKGWAGVLNKAKAEGKLAPTILNMNITNALTKMAKTQEKIVGEKEEIPESKEPTHPEKRRRNSSSKIPKPTSNWARLRSHSAFAKKESKPATQRRATFSAGTTKTTVITPDVTNNQKEVKATTVTSPPSKRKISGVTGPNNKKISSDTSQAVSSLAEKPKPGTSLKKRKSETALTEKTVTPSTRRKSAAPAVSPVKRSSAPSTPSVRRKSEVSAPSTPSAKRKSEAPPVANRRSSSSSAPLTRAKSVTSVVPDSPAARRKSYSATVSTPGTARRKSVTAAVKKPAKPETAPKPSKQPEPLTEEGLAEPISEEETFSDPEPLDRSVRVEPAVEQEGEPMIDGGRPEVHQEDVVGSIGEENVEKVEEEETHEGQIEVYSKESEVVQEEGKGEDNTIEVEFEREDGTFGEEKEDDPSKNLCRKDNNGQNKDDDEVEDENEEKEVLLPKEDKVGTVGLRKGSADLETKEDKVGTVGKGSADLETEEDTTNQGDEVKYSPIRKGSADLTGTLAWNDPLHQSILSQLREEGKEDSFDASFDAPFDASFADLDVTEDEGEVEGDVLRIICGSDDEIVEGPVSESDEGAQGEESNISQALQDLVDHYEASPKTDYEESVDEAFPGLSSFRKAKLATSTEEFDEADDKSEDPIPAVTMLETGKISPESKWKIIRKNLKKKILKQTVIKEERGCDPDHSSCVQEEEVEKPPVAPKPSTVRLFEGPTQCAVLTSPKVEGAKEAILERHEAKERGDQDKELVPVSPQSPGHALVSAPDQTPDQTPEAVSLIYSSIAAIPVKKRDSSVNIPLAIIVGSPVPPLANKTVKTFSSPTRTNSAGPDQPPIKILGSDGISNKIKFFESQKEEEKSFELDGKASAPNLDLPGFQPFRRDDEKQQAGVIGGKQEPGVSGGKDFDSETSVKSMVEEKGSKVVDPNTCVTSEDDGEEVCTKSVASEGVEVCVKEAEELLDINDSIIADIEGLLELSDGVNDVNQGVAKGSIVPLRPTRMFRLSTDAVALDKLLEVISRPLAENELWILLRCCLDTWSTQSECLVTPSTALLTPEGQVYIQQRSDSLSMVPPEMQSQGAPEVKGCIFSLGATLWHCADYSLDQSEEPEISQTLQSLLLDMTHPECGVRPDINRISKVYSEHMGSNKRNLRALYSLYNSLEQTRRNPQLPSIQIIINKDGLNHVLQPGDNIPITYPGYISADSSLNGPGQSYNNGPGQIFNPGPAYNYGQSFNESGERRTSSDLSVGDPSSITPLFPENPRQANNTSGLSSQTYLVDEAKRSDVPQFNLIEATMLEDSPIPRTRSTHDLHQPPPFPLPDFNLIEATQLADLSISSGEFSPIPQTFTSLSEGMTALFSQLGKLSKSDRSYDALPHPEVDSTPYSAPNTPLTSSPKQEPLSFQEISISPIKELSESAPLSESVQRRRSRKSVDFTEDHTPGKRNSLVECLSNLDDTDNLAKDLANPDILDLLNLDLDASDVLEFLEDRIEVNLDKLEKGNTIVNSLAEVENDISFKRLQVESMTRVVKRDDLEMSQVIFDVKQSGVEERSEGRGGLVRRSSVLVEEQEGSYLTMPNKEQEGSYLINDLETYLAPSEQSKEKKKVSIPVHQLLGFFTSNLSQQDSSEVLQALKSTLLDISEQQEKKHDLSTIAELSELVQHTPRKRPARLPSASTCSVEHTPRLPSTCSVEEQLNFSVTDLHEEGSNSLVDISSAYGRTSPDGGEDFFSDASLGSENRDGYYKIGSPPKYFDDTPPPLSSEMPSYS